MDSRKHAMAVLVALLFTAAAFGQAKPETAKPDRANVLLRFEKEGTVSASCSQTLGIITQSMLEVEGVKNAKVDAKSNGVQVSYDPGKTTPQKIVTAFNKENPDTPLQSSGATRTPNLHRAKKIAPRECGWKDGVSGRLGKEKTLSRRKAKELT